MAHDIARRRAIAAAAVAPVAALLAARSAEANAASGGTIPAGFAGVDPRTALRVPLWQRLDRSNPIFPGDPEVKYKVFTTIAESGYLLEQITSLGTHTGTHISAPVHFVEGGDYLSQLDEGWTLMPLTVIDVAARVRAKGGDFGLDVADLKAWEQRYGRFPANGGVLLYTGFSKVFGQPGYFDPAPGFTGAATAWLYDQRGIRAIGSDTFGPDASSDADFGSTATALARGGITVENVGPGLGSMRPYGDWVSINGGRPKFSGFQMGITGFTR